ncbi:MAG: hypothetical protein P8130_12465 [Deltaproteobacteria bacterium]
MLIKERPLAICPIVKETQEREFQNVFLYAVAIPLAFPWLGASLVLYVFVALLWLIQDRRIETVQRRQKLIKSGPVLRSYALRKR